MIEVTYICAKTNKKVVSTEGLPAGWVVPTYSLAKEDEERPIPPKHSVVCFSGKGAMDKYMKDLLKNG